MATVTKPLALNESLNTTENTPRNIADVLAEELSNIANNVKPDADDIPYDNTASGLSANNVQNAIDEVVSDVDGKVSKSGDTMSGNLSVDTHAGTTSVISESRLILGNNIASGTAGNSRGHIWFYTNRTNRVDLAGTNITANRDIRFPDKSGTLAVTSEVAFSTSTYFNSASGKKVVFTKDSTTNGASLISIHHDGGNNYIYGIWHYNYFIPLATNGFTVESVTATSLKITSPVAYIRVGALSDIPLAITLESA